MHSVVFTHSPLKCCVGWHDIGLSSSPLRLLFLKRVHGVGCTCTGQDWGCAVPVPRRTVSCCSVSEPLSPRSSGLARGSSSRAFLTPPVRLSCTPLVCAPSQLYAEGRQASGALGGTPQQRSPGSLSHCVEGVSCGGSLAHIMGHKDPVDFTGSDADKLIMTTQCCYPQGRVSEGNETPWLDP